MKVLMRDILVDGMAKISPITKLKVMVHSEKVLESGLSLLDNVFLTSTIVMQLVEYPTGVVAWAYYPKTGCEDYIFRKGDDESLEDFTERSIDRILKNHNWFNKDVELLINSRRKGKE